MQNNIEKTQMTFSLEKLQKDVENLRDDVRRLENQMATLSNVEAGTIIRDVDAGESPHEVTGKSQMCKRCKSMRMPHRSNAHYTCEMRHTTIEPTWTCEFFNDKKNQRVSEAGATCGH